MEDIENEEEGVVKDKTPPPSRRQVKPQDTLLQSASDSNLLRQSPFSQPLKGERRGSVSSTPQQQVSTDNVPCMIVVKW